MTHHQRCRRWPRRCSPGPLRPLQCAGLFYTSGRPLSRGAGCHPHVPGPDSGPELKVPSLLELWHGHNVEGTDFADQQYAISEQTSTRSLLPLNDFEGSLQRLVHLEPCATKAAALHHQCAGPNPRARIFQVGRDLHDKIKSSLQFSRLIRSSWILDCATLPVAIPVFSVSYYV